MGLDRRRVVAERVEVVALLEMVNGFFGLNFDSIFNTRIGIFSGSHLGNLTDLENAIRAMEPPDYIKNADFSYAIDRPYQSVQHHLLKLKAFSEKENKSRINLTFSSQLNIRKEFDITRSSATTIPQLEMNLYTNMIDLVWEHFADKKLKGSVGLNGMHQLNFINYRYFIPNFQSLDLGLWGAEKYQFGSWQFEMGLVSLSLSGALLVATMFW